MFITFKIRHWDVIILQEIIEKFQFNSTIIIPKNKKFKPYFEYVKNIETYEDVIKENTLHGKLIECNKEIKIRSNAPEYIAVLYLNGHED